MAGLTPKIVTLGQILKETGVRVGEAAALKWVDIDFERKIMTFNNPEKRSLPRIKRVSDKLITMVNRLPRKQERIFGGRGSIEARYNYQRKRLAYKLDNPRLLKITFHTFRQLVWHNVIS